MALIETQVTEAATLAHSQAVNSLQFDLSRLINLAEDGPIGVAGAMELVEILKLMDHELQTIAGTLERSILKCRHVKEAAAVLVKTSEN